MSLRIWLPLINNTNNQGCDSTTFAGTPASWSDGKIGTAATFNGSVGNVIYNNTTAYNYTDNFSFCIWVYPIYTGSTAQYAFTVGRADAGGYGYGLQVGSSSEVTVRFGNKGINVSCASNTWNHIAMVVKGSSIYIYKNGILYSTTAVGSLPTYSDGNGVGLGCFHYSGNIYPYYGRINDFRIYDHALSAKEVKEISKGLVVHFPLDGNGKCNDNILPGTFVNEVTYTYPSSSYSDKWGATTSIIPSASQYVLSFWAKSTVNGDKVRAHYYNPNTTTRCESSQGVVTTASDGNIDITLSTEWKKYWVIYTQSSTTAVKRVIFPRMWNGGSGTVSVKQVKFEEGTIPTPWCPNSSDSAYTTLGYNSTIETDTSGFKNNGTKSGTLSITSDTSRYSASTTFSSGSHIVTTLTTGGYANSFTFAWWGKIVNYTGHMMWGFSNGNRLNLYMSNNGSNFYWNTGDGNGNPFGSVKPSDYAGSWHHFAITGDGTTAKLYIDGIFKANASTYKGITGTTIYMNGWDSGTSYNFNGSLSDFRIYATALSADDVKELYQNSASIADNGSVLCYEFEEV